ncbi:SusC/RagA family TonB-linked outer membrane protein [Portibacter lacus]|uniref:SusC/RagA family TonB-linked outer membrane protein n=1 Tax=Portibacter lacus TaxID=1099794 RepID=A0AA37SM23_9BACT|nr:SusC/RagA family TonB-linked outer membrane protein [Portibacter lacus]GLR15549.1 SusC/RagA family TonB-linked outer membrane protein [Portibacter lacus]
MNFTKFNLLNVVTTLMLGLWVISPAISQKLISGIVLDEQSNDPLIGATIIAKSDQGIGTTTDFDGKFALDVPENESAVIISYTGYSDKEVVITSSEMGTILLSFGELLDEVVVVGYGTVKREDATGSIQSVTSKDFNKGAITGPQQLLSGKVAGVAITTDGSPGGGSKIRIRGESSLSASNDPLIVIDGIPLDNGGVSGNRNPLNVINPNDIESMTVLKDASAAAIYGNRAAGGVIIITTKQGELGKKIRVGYNGNISIGNTSNRVDVLNADEYRSIVQERYDDGDPTTPDHPALGLLGDASTDWQSEIYRQAIGTDHNLSASGGIGVVPYRVSIGYTDMQGILKTDNFNRYTAGINLSPGLLNNSLQLKLHFKGMLTQNDFADRGAIGAALGFDPTRSPRDPDSPYGGFTTWTNVNGSPNPIAPTNPVALLELRDDRSTVKRYIANASADYRLPFFPALRANLNVGYDFSNGSGSVKIPTTAAFAFNAINGGGVDNIYEQTKENSLLEFYLNYKETFGKNTFDVLGGYSWQHFFVNNTFTSSNVAGTPSETQTGSDPAEFFLLSLFGRVNYNYNDRILLTGTLRRDGTSRFAPENRWGIFPAAALAVKVIDNDNNKFNNVKLRLGWGVTGQQEIGDYYAYLARYQTGLSNAAYQFGNEFISTLRPNGYDGNIRWEETTTYNIGIDYSIIRDRVSGSVDVYQRDTKDLLNRIPVPAGTNLTNFITTNVGNMQNRGIEFALNTTPVLTKNITWDLSANLALNRNEITKLTATEDPSYIGILTGGISGGVGSNIQIHSVGFAPSSFYVFEQKYDEGGNIIEGEFVDRNNDGMVNEQDKYRFKNPTPDYSIGLTSNLSIGDFDFSFAGRANIGNYVYNNVATDMGYYDRLYNSNNTIWNIHQAAIDNNIVSQSNVTFSDHYVVDASFFRLDHITAGYNFSELLGHNVRLYATIQNPLVVTKYEGLDPEIGNGIDNSVYPRPRTILIGVSANF